jgi:hypothetical protein
MKRRELCDLRVPQVFIGWRIWVRNSRRPTNERRSKSKKWWPIIKSAGIKAE